MTEQATVWCDKAGFLVTQDDIDKRCPYWECPCKQGGGMSAQTLILDGGDTLDGTPRKLRQ